MKFLTLFISFISSALLFCSCSSTPKPEPQAQVMTPVYVAGTDVAEMRMDDVRNPENVEVYTVGRYVDPNNSNIMYEKTELYRLADSSSWNTRPNPPIKLSDGSTLIAPENTNSAVVKPLYSELEKRINEYRNAADSNNRKYALMIQKGTNDINQSVQKMNVLIKQNENLIKKQNDLSDKIKKQDEVTKELRSLIEGKNKSLNSAAVDKSLEMEVVNDNNNAAK